MDKPLFVFVPGELSQPVFRQAPPSDFQPAQNSRHMFRADSTIGRTKTGIHSLLIRYLAHYFCGGADVIGDSQLSQSLSDNGRSSVPIAVAVSVQGLQYQEGGFCHGALEPVPMLSRGCRWE